VKQIFFWLAIYIVFSPKGTLASLWGGLQRFLVWLGVIDFEEEKRGKTAHHHLWESRHQNIPLKFYGGGANRKFDYYFSGHSRVSVSSVREIVEWLLGCEYVSDPEQFNKRDHWQHPVDFEKTRRGDCEDFALWAWRKLVELGHDAEFMVGKWLHDGRVGTHAWVFLRHEGEQFVLETTGRSPERIVKLHEDAVEHYVPFAAVDNQLQKKVYNGLTHWIMTRM
jgi:hypothetical protein